MYCMIKIFCKVGSYVVFLQKITIKCWEEPLEGDKYVYGFNGVDSFKGGSIPELMETRTLNNYGFLHISHAVIKRVFKKT